MSPARARSFGRVNSLADGSPDHFEMAKDLAAVANDLGGRMIVRAFESNSCVARYDRLTQPEAQQICNSYTTAQTARLSP